MGMQFPKNFYYFWQNTSRLCREDECQPGAKSREAGRSGGNNPDASPILGRYSGFFRNTPQLCCGVGYWGAATSAHQVEGGNKNDWTEWEQQSLKLKVKNAKLKAWPDFILKNHPNPLQEENYISGAACDHYRRFPEDFDMAKALGHNAHRFSIEWSRIEPEEGKFNEKEIAHYREVVKALRTRGLEPFVTLWHWTLPLWVAQKGGWENSETVEYFSRYCGRIIQELKHEATFLVILNEPVLWASNAYRTGNFPPGKQNIVAAWRVLKNLKKAHRAAYGIAKKINPDFQVGITQNMGWFVPFFLRPFYDALMFNFPNAIAKETDFFGLDYYRKIPFFRRSRADSDIGWEIDPRGLYFVVKKVWRKFKKPIFILENGIADARDEKRAEFIRLHIAAMMRAMDEGADVRGYFYWSLLDNFEWENGFWPRFGLLEMDYKTTERKIRPSAWEYKKIIDESAS